MCVCVCDSYLWQYVGIFILDNVNALQHRHRWEHTLVEHINMNEIIFLFLCWNWRCPNISYRSIIEQMMCICLCACVRVYDFDFIELNKYFQSVHTYICVHYNNQCATEINSIVCDTIAESTSLAIRAMCICSTSGSMYMHVCNARFYILLEWINDFCYFICVSVWVWADDEILFWINAICVYALRKHDSKTIIMTLFLFPCRLNFTRVCIVRQYNVIVDHMILNNVDRGIYVYRT